MSAEHRINENILLTLYENEVSQRIEIGIKIIDQPLEHVKQGLFQLLNSESSSLQNISAFIAGQAELEQIEKYYAYCNYLDMPFQGFTASNKKALQTLEDAMARIRIGKKTDKDDYDPVADIASTKSILRMDYRQWFHAFEIHRAYRECNDDPTVLSFSHRICGWSDPRYRLTPNFSLELKTNFGYGRSSYFYTKLTYKNVEITPISDWVRYEKAEFMEIVRYSRKHKLEHAAWTDAMQYTQEACNLSRTSESDFVEKYIINECKQMVDGLVHALNHTKFELLNAWHQPFFVDKTGHVLMEYRGEKISGALDFIEKILEFEHITSVAGFIKQIEDCNSQLSPLLRKELVLLEVKIGEATKERAAYEPTYDDAAAQKKAYDEAREELKKELIGADKMTWQAINHELWAATFNDRFKEYEEFLKSYQNISNKWLKLNQHLANLRQFQKNITSYHQKIIHFFGRNAANEV